MKETKNNEGKIVDYGKLTCVAMIWRQKITITLFSQTSS
jgi:hypothetical protein